MRGANATDSSKRQISMAFSSVHPMVALARQGERLRTEGKSDDEVFNKLAEWAAQILDEPTNSQLSQVVALAKRESQGVERYLTRTLRVVAGAQPVTIVDEADEWLQLLAIPLFFFPRKQQDISEVLTSLECRAELERSLEHTLGLGFASLHFCEYPVSIIDLESLTLPEIRKVSLDLLHQGDSAYLSPPVIDAGDSAEGTHHLSMLWPAVWTVRECDRESHSKKISGALNRSVALSRFKHRADELIEREMKSRWDINIRADIYMPALFHDAFSVYRLVDLNIMLNQALHQFKTTCNNVSFGLFGSHLRYSLLDVEGAVLQSNELRAPDESSGVLAAAVRAACARHGVSCTAKLPD